METSVLKKAYDRWQSTRSEALPTVQGEPEAPLDQTLGLPPEVVEEYATLASRVESALASASRRVVVVGSPTRHTGNTTVAVALAATLATGTQRAVLLCDGNLRNPAIHTKFGLERGPGLTDVVRGRAAFADAAVPSAVSQLTVLPAGSPDASPQTFFQSQEFLQQLSAWGKEFGYVVFDTAPFGAIAEPLTLAKAASGTVVVVRAAKTVREVASEVVDNLRDAGVKVLGAVLNRRRFYIPEWIYKRV